MQSVSSSSSQPAGRFTDMGTKAFVNELPLKDSTELPPLMSRVTELTPTLSFSKAYRVTHAVLSLGQGDAYFTDLAALGDRMKEVVAGYDADKLIKAARCCTEVLKVQPIGDVLLYAPLSALRNRVIQIYRQMTDSQLEETVRTLAELAKCGNGPEPILAATNTLVVIFLLESQRNIRNAIAFSSSPAPSPPPRPSRCLWISKELFKLNVICFVSSVCFSLLRGYLRYGSLDSGSIS